MSLMDDAQHRLAARVTDLESALAHQQREYEQLNQVVIEQANTIQELGRQLALLKTSMQQVQDNSLEERDLVDEKPPHY